MPVAPESNENTDTKSIDRETDFRSMLQRKNSGSMLSPDSLDTSSAPLETGTYRGVIGSS